MRSRTRFTHGILLSTVLSVVALGFTATSASAQIEILHNVHKEKFMAALEPGYLVPAIPDGLTEGPLELSASGNAYAAVTDSVRGLWGEAGALTTNYDDEILALTFTTDNVRAFGGEFIQNSIIFGDLTDPIPITVTSAKGLTATVMASLGAPFAGFLLYDKTDYFVTATIGDPNQLEPDMMWPVAKTFFMGGNASSAPEPGTLTFVLPIAIGIVLAKRRCSKGK